MSCFLICEKLCHWLFDRHCTSSEFLKLSIIIILHQVYLIPGLMTLALFQGRMCVRIINCKLFLDSYSLCMVLTYLKKIRHGTLCVTGVCLRDIANTTFHLNESSSCSLLCTAACICGQYVIFKGQLIKS